MTIKSRADIMRAVSEPNISIKVLNHWQPQLVGNVRKPLAVRKSGRKGIQTNGYYFLGLDSTGKETEMWAEVPPAKDLRFNDDGSVTFFPETQNNWTLQFGA